MACRLPGANGLDAYWRLLTDGVDAIIDVPAERFDVDALYDPAPAVPGRVVSRWGGFLDQVDRFDAAFFGISPREASRMDPQQRVLLEVAWEALEDGGQAPDGLMGSDTGVFVGVMNGDYRDLVFGDPAEVDVYAVTGCARSVVAGRLSYALGLQGPSLELDTACSSSLVAVHMACQSLRSGECGLALAGGVNLVLGPSESIGYSQARLLAADGRCKFGDASADGFVRSDGAGVVVLKPLSVALAAGDPVRAVIRGSAVNSDGNTGHQLMTPSAAGQEAVVRSACAAAGVAPGRLRYVEAHGTGTRVGDPVEISALGRVLAEGREPGSRCLVGSVKTNIGHSEAAAGVAGLIKVALCLEHGAVPASLHLREPNPEVPWADLPVAVPRELAPLPDGPEPALAGVSSLGISGTNAHVVLEAAPRDLPAPDRRPEPAEGSHLLALSARSPESLAGLASAYRAALAGDSAPPLRDVCHTAGSRRSHHDHRLALVASSLEEAVAQLDADLAGQPLAGTSAGRTAGRPRVAFVYSGHGSQWPAMGGRLLEREPVARAVLEQCDALVRARAGWSLLDELTAGDGRLAAGDVEVVQPAVFAVQLALTALWRSWGIEPDAVAGHSMGEVAAAHVAGVLSLEDAVSLICLRGRLLAGVRGQSAMAVVELSAEEADRALVAHGGRISVAAGNGPAETVVAGPRDAVERLVNELREREVLARLVKVDVASPSPDVDRLLPDLLAQLDGLRPGPASVPWCSTVTGDLLDGRECGPDYWARNLREPVRFSAAIGRLAADGHRVLLELSPHPLLLPAMQQGLDQLAGGLVLPSMRRDEEPRDVLLPSLGRLYTEGARVRWEAVAGAGARVVRVPTYRWHRERFWVDAPARPAAPSVGHPVLGPSLELAQPAGAHVWEADLEPAMDHLLDHRVDGAAVLAGTAYAELALAAASEVLGGPAILEGVEYREALPLPEAGAPPRLQVAVAPDPAGGHTFSILSRTGDEPSWVLHATGRVRAAEEPDAACGPAVAEVSAAAGRCIHEVPGSVFYRSHDERGNGWGPAFRGVERVWRRPGEALALVQAPAAVEPSLDRWLFHPALLDACGQVLAAAGTDVPGAGPFVLRGIGRVNVRARPGPRLWSHAVVHSEGGLGMEGDVSVVNDRGELVARLERMRFQRLEPRPARPAEDDVESWLYRPWWLPSLRDSAPPGAGPGAWIVLGDRRGVGDALAAGLRARGEECEVVMEPGDLDRQLAAAGDRGGRTLRGVVHLCALDAGSPEEGGTGALEAASDLVCASALRVLRALAERDGRALAERDGPGSPRLWLVTAGVHSPEPGGRVSVAQSSLWGLGRVATQEHPELRPTLVDLPADPSEGDVEELCRELCADPREDQVVLTRGARLVARLARHAVDARSKLTLDPAGSCRLEIQEPGIIDHLELRSAPRRQPEAGEVEIEVHGAGLNYRDVLEAMGAYPGQPVGAAVLGWECAGRVVAVAPDAGDLRIGDEVLAIAHPGLAAHVTVPAALVVRRPASLTVEAAAGVPIAYVTAQHALRGLARVRPGERVLIHSASGGVGTAAILVGRDAGAEILATAGTADKRAHLASLGVRHVFDSRSLDFVEGVLGATGGEGVDVVLNSLQGDAIAASLSLLRPYGRFLELGKRDILAGAQLGLRAFDRNLSFFAIDVVRMARERPEETGAILREVVARIAAGAIRPPAPATFPLSGAADAFRLVARARHVGKVVLAPPGAGARAMGRTRMRQEGTYLVTGGLGGLGLEVARWMVDRGARRVVLVGRTGLPENGSRPADDPRAAAVRRLEELGATVRVAAVDVSEEDQLRSLLESLDADGWPPVAGVVHAAGVLAYRPLVDLTPAELRAVMRPKVLGAWLLHSLLRDVPLDFFLLFSSASGLLSSPLLGGYAAANAFLDALAHDRRAQGLPALSIDWGFWAGVGMAADHRRAEGRDLAPQGIGSFSVAQGLEVLDTLLAGSPPQVAAIAVDWHGWRRAHPMAAAAPFLSDLAASETAGATEPPAEPDTGVALTREALRDAPPGDRPPLLERYVLAQAVGVLGRPASGLSPSSPLNRAGLDSLMALELTNRVRADLGVSVPVLSLLRGASVSELVAVVLELVHETPAAGGTPDRELAGAPDGGRQGWEEIRL
jgi:acyl transferase domain-containing protein